MDNNPDTPAPSGQTPPAIPGHSAAWPRSEAVAPQAPAPDHAASAAVPPPPPPPPPPLPTGGGKDDRWGRGPRGPMGVGYSEPPRPKRSRVLPVVVLILLVVGLGFYLFASVAGRILETALTGGQLKGALALENSQIALIRIEEPIMPGMSYDFWMKSLAEVGDSPKIRGVLLRLNSPGGAVASSQEIYDEVLRLREQGKKVYVSMGDVAASGAYYIAAAADRIIANRGTLTGSIGVISEFYQLQKLAENIGVDFEVVKTGRFKDSGNSFREMTEGERKMFDQLLSNAYDQFLTDILSQRDGPLASAFTSFKPEEYAAFQFEQPPAGAATREFLEQMADGRVYSGEQAVRLGLVDELGSLNHAVDRLAKELKIKGEPGIYEPVRQIGFWDILQAKVGGAIPGASSLGHPSRALQYRMPRL